MGFLLESFRDAGEHHAQFVFAACDHLPSAGYADVQRGASEESLEEDQTLYLYL